MRVFWRSSNRKQAMRTALVYTVRFAGAVVVLHVFQKKSKSGIETPKPDMDLIETRLKKATELMKESKP